MTTNLQGWSAQAIQCLKGKSDFPVLESQVLLAHSLHTSREWIITHPEFELNQDQVGKLESLLHRLLDGEPLPYITGVQAFYGLDLTVTRDVLIPRPETELLVEEAINWLRDHPERRTALDMGTGSGAIAVTLLDQISDLHVTASDLSPAALDVARMNAGKLGVEGRIQLLQSDLWKNIDQSYDLVAANLPYIPSADLQELAVSRHEPVLALDGGRDGLQVIGEFLKEAHNHIKPRGFLLLEIEAGQGKSAFELVRNRWPDANSKLITDYSNLPRLITIQLT